MFSMRLHAARRDVHAAQGWLATIRSFGPKGWSRLADWSERYPTYEEALEAAELAFAQAEERLAAELIAELVE